MKKTKRVPNKAPEVTRVLLVDDHPMVRERLTEVIQSEPGFMICGEAEDRQQALDAIATSQPDIVIVDLTLKNSSGIDLIKDVRVRWPDLAMLVISMHDELLHAERALRAGARGYITKQEATRKILLALETVRKGEVYLSEKVAMTIARQATGQPRAKAGLTIDRLSDREFQVFQLIGRGRSTQEIAAELHLDRHTIETYRSRIKEKLILKSGHELLQRAIHWGQFGGTEYHI
jgi:DNA-binding NarL/FixJ family response regulator